MTKELGTGKGILPSQHQTVHVWVLTEALATRASCHCRLVWRVAFTSSSRATCSTLHTRQKALASDTASWFHRSM